MKKILMMAVVPIFLLSSSAIALDTISVTLQNGLNGYTGCSDAYLNMAKVNNNYGNSGTLAVSNTKVLCGIWPTTGAKIYTYSRARAVLRFNLDSFPSNIRIIKADLTLFGKKFETFNNGTKTIKEVGKSWQESSVTWKSPWNKEGGDNGSSVTASNQMKTGIETFDMISSVKNILENGSKNNGWIISMPNTSYGIEYSSSENDIQENRPKLEITYVIMESDPPVVNITSLNDNDVLKYGDLHTITWVSSDNDGVAKQNLFISHNNGEQWDSIASFDGSVQSYNWEVPCKISDQYLVKVEAIDFAGNYSFDISDNTFKVIPDTVNGTGTIVKQLEWDVYHDNLGSSDTLIIVEDSVFTTMYKVNKQTIDYPYVSLNGQFPDNIKLMKDQWIRIKYRSSSDFFLQLDDPELSEEGIPYQCRIPESSYDEVPRELYIHLCKEVFSQPEWVSTPSTFDLNKVIGLQFSGDMHLGYDTSAIAIYHLEFFNGNTVPISNQLGSKKLSSAQVSILPSGKLSLENFQPGQYTFSIRSINGQLVSQKDIIISNGVSVLPFNYELSKGVYLVQLKGNAEISQNKILIQ